MTTPFQAYVEILMRDSYEPQKMVRRKDFRRITKEQVEEMKRLLAAGASPKSMAKQFNVSLSTVRKRRAELKVSHY